MNTVHDSKENVANGPKTDSTVKDLKAVVCSLSNLYCQLLEESERLRKEINALEEHNANLKKMIRMGLTFGSSN